MMRKIRRDDEVVILAGKDKGKRGRVKSILSSGKVVIDGLNMIKKHQKPVPAINNHGGIISKEAAIHISNIAILNKSMNKADRVGFRFKSNKKVRFFKSNNEIISNME